MKSPLSAVVVFTLLLLSCRKNEDKKPLQFRLNGTLYVMDSLESTRSYFFSSQLDRSFFRSYTANRDVFILFNCDNYTDTTQVGKYITSKLPISPGLSKRVGYFNIYIAAPSDPNAGMYDSLHGNFVVNFNSIQDRVISLDFSGTISGGQIPPGGPTSTTGLINRKNFELTDGRFNSKFSGW